MKQGKLQIVLQAELASIAFNSVKTKGIVRTSGYLQGALVKIGDFLKSKGSRTRMFEAKP